jgi:hypothetical protein
MKIQDAFNTSEYSLLFLRPAPPKMMIKNSVIKTKLFPLYDSVAPVNYQDPESLKMDVSTFYCYFEFSIIYLNEKKFQA